MNVLKGFKFLRTLSIKFNLTSCLSTKLHLYIRFVHIYTYIYIIRLLCIYKINTKLYFNLVAIIEQFLLLLLLFVVGFFFTFFRASPRITVSYFIHSVFSFFFLNIYIYMKSYKFLIIKSKRDEKKIK